MLYLEPFTKYADFSGRATRSEYWLFTIINSVILNQSQGGMCICRVLGIGAGVSRECFGP